MTTFEAFCKLCDSDAVDSRISVSAVTIKPRTLFRKEEVMYVYFISLYLNQEPIGSMQAVDNSAHVRVVGRDDEVVPLERLLSLKTYLEKKKRDKEAADVAAKDARISVAVEQIVSK